MKKRLTRLVILSPIIGAVLGYFVGYAFYARWFDTAWHTIEKSPVPIRRLVALDKDSVWVETVAGKLYHNASSSTCQSGCWQEVVQLPAFPQRDSSGFLIIDKSCAAIPPLFLITSIVAECHQEAFIGHSYVFALRRDNNLLFWQADLYGEWSFIPIGGGVCLGAIVLFFGAALPLMALKFREWLNKRRNSGLAA
jgi:hypothetical protein